MPAANSEPRRFRPCDEPGPKGRLSWSRPKPETDRWASAASLDEPLGEDTTPLGDLVADRQGVDPADTAIAHEQRERVWTMLRLLPKRHRDVLVRRYGLIGGRTHSHTEIARTLGVGEERSRQLEREALHRLRSAAQTTARAA